MKEEFPIVTCPCGCGMPASDHPHPFGVTESHRQWCRHLFIKNLLNDRHLKCG